ncbi:flavin reductase family protein [Streptacidiphilus sp. EB103A]|uniref:flavin reductase family protein n=1 Tax=Streptacidiphilus sp. EB103A TaxID=3156275 RepID=UPI003518EF76
MSEEIYSVALYGEITAESFRAALGHFCSGVSVVSAMTSHGPVGFTCQAFSSLSLKPPQVIVCPSRSSTTWPMVSAVGRFCVNVLAEDQAGLSEGFAHSGGDKFSSVEWTHTPSGSPMLRGAAAWIDCAVHASYDGGDHLIVRGDVRWLDVAPGSRPLLYHRGHYARIADHVP